MKYSVISVPSVVNFKDTELGPLPEEWRVVRLGEVVKPTKGRKPPRVVKEYQSSALPYLTAEYFRSGLVTYFVPYEDCRNLPICSQKDLVLIWDGSNAGQIFTGLSGVLASTMARLDLLDSTVEHQFLYFYLLMQFELLNSQTTGSTIPHVNKNVFRSLPIPLPPLPEQRAIAHVLRTVQEAKAATERVVAALRELKKSLMRHLFTYGPAPVAGVGAKHVSPLRETEIGPIPEHWQVVRLGEVITRAQYGLSKRGSMHGQYPILRMNNLSEGRVYPSDLQFVDLSIEELQRFHLDKEDILFNRTNSFELVGKVGIFLLEEDFIFASYLIRIKCDREKILPSYLSLYLSWETTQSRLKTLASRGVSQSNISASKLKYFPIPLPPLPEQREIARILQAVDRRIAAEEAYARALGELFKTLLHELMTGRRRVHIVEEGVP